MLDLAERLGGVESVIAQLREQWPKILREALDGSKRREEPTTAGADAALSGGGPLTLASGLASLDHRLDRLGEAAQTVAATSLQSAFRGRVARQVTRQLNTTLGDGLRALPRALVPSILVPPSSATTPAEAPAGPLANASDAAAAAPPEPPLLLQRLSSSVEALAQCVPPEQLRRLQQCITPGVVEPSPPGPTVEGAADGNPAVRRIERRDGVPPSL